jgi:hypothetical protein
MSTEPEATLDLFETFTHAETSQGAERLPALTVSDRCDAPDCSAQAYVRAKLPSGRLLDFCGHHGHALLPALAGQGAVIRDDTHLLVGNRLGSATNSGA